MESLQREVQSLEATAAEAEALEQQRTAHMAQVQRMPQLQQELKQLAQQAAEAEALQAQIEQLRASLQVMNCHN